jgi:hypothetical protein
MHVHIGVIGTQQTQEKAMLPGHHRRHAMGLQLIAYMYAGAVAHLDRLFGLKVKIHSFFASIPDQCCKVCYMLGERTTSTCGSVCRKFAGIILYRK